MAKFGLPKGSGKLSKVREKSLKSPGNFAKDIEWQPCSAQPHCCFSYTMAYMSLDATKPVFWVFEKVRLKPVSSATQIIYNFEILLMASLDMILSNK